MPLTPCSLQCGTAVASRLWGQLREDVGDERNPSKGECDRSSTTARRFQTGGFCRSALRYCDLLGGILWHAGGARFGYGRRLFHRCRHLPVLSAHFAAQSPCPSAHWFAAAQRRIGDHLHNDDRGFGDSLLGFRYELDPVFRGTVLLCHAGERLGQYHPPAHQTLARVPGPRGDLEAL